MSTWPDPTRPGVPLNPEQDGWHWLKHHEATFSVAVAWYPPAGWRLNNAPMLPHEVKLLITDCCEYRGPCPTPEELAKIVLREERARGMEDAANIVKEQWNARGTLVGSINAIYVAAAKMRKACMTDGSKTTEMPPAGGNSPSAHPRMGTAESDRQTTAECSGGTQ